MKKFLLVIVSFSLIFGLLFTITGARFTFRGYINYLNNNLPSPPKLVFNTEQFPNNSGYRPYDNPPGLEYVALNMFEKEVQYEIPIVNTQASTDFFYSLKRDYMLDIGLTGSAVPTDYMIKASDFERIRNYFINMTPTEYDNFFESNKIPKIYGKDYQQLSLSMLKRFVPSFSDINIYWLSGDDLSDNFFVGMFRFFKDKGQKIIDITTYIAQYSWYVLKGFSVAIGGVFNA